MLAGLLVASAQCEIVFLDAFNTASGSITNSKPWIDVQGLGWQANPAAPNLQSDGSGHLFALAQSGDGVAGVPLTPIGGHGSLTVSATVRLPLDPADWIGLGFAERIQALDDPGAGSGPWLKVQGDGQVTLMGGPGASNGVAKPGFANQGGPVGLILNYDAFTKTADVAVLIDGATQQLWKSFSFSNSSPEIRPRNLVLQFPKSDALSNRWVSDVTVDWLPRPKPMLSLPSPVPGGSVIDVGTSSGGDDTALIQSALTAAAAKPGGAEVRFSPGATYVVTNGSTVADIPLVLSRATNVLINGNGCRIKITNPRIGFLTLNFCTNVLVQGFTVDYEPLPFTQGVVSTNLALATPSRQAIQFRVDPGYPLPTAPNYLDADAVRSASRWGIIMDPDRPGRCADNRWTLYEYQSAISLGDGYFEVEFPKSNRRLPTIQPGDIWCMVSRWNGSAVFHVHATCQVTFLNLTVYAGAAGAFSGDLCSLVNEINCQVLIGPPPPGATKSRVKSTNADGGYFVDPHIGPWVEGCNFTGLSDDVANANLIPFVISGSVTGLTATLQPGLFVAGGPPRDITADYIQVGDDITFYAGRTGMVLDRARVQSMALPNVTFDHPIAGLNPGPAITNTLLFNHALNASAVYLHNQFRNSRIHGIYCRADNMLIAHNEVSGMGLCAIGAHPALDLAAPNSFIPTNVVILDNYLADCGYSYEGINLSIPDNEPGYALIQLHKAVSTSDNVTQGFEISGIRILNNAFADWRRGAISLHNAADVTVSGNYFTLPLTNNGLMAPTNHVIGDLWACDYASLRFSGNVKGTIPADHQALRQDGKFVPDGTGFIPLTAPRLQIQLAGGDLMLAWTNPVPGFVAQQEDLISTGTNWIDLPIAPSLSGASNVLIFPPPGNNQKFYRLRQR